MKVHIALAATLLLLGSAAALAQDYTPTPVAISTEKVKLNGKVYYAHLVMERQTLFGIAKAYGVTEEELYQANPSLKETGLQKSSILLIPTEPQPAPAVQKEAPGKETPKAQGYKSIPSAGTKTSMTLPAVMKYRPRKSWISTDSPAENSPPVRCSRFP